MSTSDTNSVNGSQTDSVSNTFANHGPMVALSESGNRIELVTSGLTPEFIQQITSAVEDKSISGKKRTADEANEPLDLRTLFYTIKDSVPNCTDELIEKNIRILNEHNINVLLIPLLNQTTALAMSLDLGLLLAAQMELQKPTTRPASKKPKIVSPPRELTIKNVEERIKSNPKLMERFPREGDFEVINPKTVRCTICKKDIHLASEGSLSRLVEHVYGKFSKTRVTTTPQHLAKLLKRDYMHTTTVQSAFNGGTDTTAKTVEEKAPSTLVPPPHLLANLSAIDLDKILSQGPAVCNSTMSPNGSTVRINKQDRYVKKLRELRREFSKEQNQILCYCLKPALKHFTKSGEMFWTCQKWKADNDCSFTRFNMPLDQLSDDEQIDDEISLTQV